MTRPERVYFVDRGKVSIRREHEINIYSWLLWEGREATVRKISEYPRWGNIPHGESLRIVKNTAGLGEIFWVAGRVIASEIWCDKVKRLCPTLRFMPVVIERAFHLPIQSPEDPGLARADEIRGTYSDDPADETATEWIDRLVVKYAVPVPKTQYFEVIAPSTDKELEKYPIVQRIPAKELGSDIDIRPAAVEEFGWARECVRHDVVALLDEQLQRPYFRVIPIDCSGRIVREETRPDDR